MESNDVKLRRLQLMVFSTMFVGYACYAYNRKGVSLALPKLMEEGLRKQDAGLIISCQNLAYAISKFLGGILSDRLSAKVLFSSGLLCSGVATILFGTADSLLLFCAFWFLNGFAQGCGWPSCAKIIRQWYSPAQFGTWWSILSASANVSGGVAPFVATFIVLNYGWRASLFVAGGVSIAMGCISFFTLHNSPVDLGLPSMIDNSKKNDNKKNKSTPPGGLSDLFKSPFLWLVSLAYCVIFCAKTSAVDWGQVYLMEQHKHSAYIGSALTSSIESGGFFGGIAAGMLTDFAVRNHNKSLHYNPRLPAAILFFMITSICLHILVFNVTADSSKLFIAALGSILGACLYGDIAIFGIMASESAPVHLSGSSHAIVALAANVGAIISGLPFSLVATAFGWSSVFMLIEVLCVATSLVMLLCVRMDSRIALHLHQD